MIGAGRSLELDGWALLPGFLSAEALALARADLADSLSVRTPTCVRQPGNDLLPLRWDDLLVARILRSESHVQQIHDALEARDLRWISGYVSVKAPASPPLWWHQDWWCWDHPISFGLAAPQVAVLCYLADTDEKNGALRVLSGSHHANMPIHSELPESDGMRADGLPAHHPAMSDLSGQRTLSVRAGDAVALDYRLLHGTHANDGSHRRDCILLSFMPDWAGLPSELKAHLVMHSAQPGVDEARAVDDSGYAALLPAYAGAPASIDLNRRPPAAFRARSVNPVTQLPS
jgi:ectoine hydroxylase-related dioxygenase (phytanoyl-CoA dioxygenase family)